MGIRDKGLIVPRRGRAATDGCWRDTLARRVTRPHTRPAWRLLALVVAVWITAVRPAAAQPPDPGPIGPFAIDLHGLFLPFPDDPALAASRGLTQVEMPGLGLGADVGAHVYPLRWGVVTFGIGGHLAIGRSTHTPLSQAPASERAVAERFVSLSPQISFNFGKGDGWSYLSGGIGRTIWSIVPEGAEKTLADDERLKTIDYGGGARWFLRPHLAFTFDVRFYAINPGTPVGDRPGSPRATLMVIGGGISLK